MSDLDQSVVGIWFYEPIDGSSIFQTNAALKLRNDALDADAARTHERHAVQLAQQPTLSAAVAVLRDMPDPPPGVIFAAGRDL